MSSQERIGSWSNDVGDGNENGKKPSRFRLANNNFARASRFFVHFFAFTARLRCEIANFESAKLLVLCRTWPKTNDFIFLQPWYSLLEFNSRIVCQHLTNWTRRNKRDTVWSSANPLLSDVFVTVAVILLKLIYFIYLFIYLFIFRGLNPNRSIIPGKSAHFKRLF